jgi:hypothetical protein
MQANKAADLKKAWKDKPCSHPQVEKEYYLGAQTGDYVRTTCGETFIPSELEREVNPKKSDS